MNKTLANAGREILKDLLSQCTPEQQMLFKRMYAHKNVEIDINHAVDEMEEERISWAISQCERTVFLNSTKNEA